MDHRTLVALSVLLAVVFAAGCGPKAGPETKQDSITRQLPGSEDCRKLSENNPDCHVSIWNEWAIVGSMGTEEMFTHIMRWNGNEWVVVTWDSTKIGFTSVALVKPHIPDLTQTGAEQLGLTNEEDVDLPAGEQDE